MTSTKSPYHFPPDAHVMQLLDSWMTRRTHDWQESAAQGLSEFLQIPMGKAREAVLRMFNVIEDVEYLVLIDCHVVTDEQREHTFPVCDPDSAE